MAGAWFKDTRLVVMRSILRPIGQCLLLLLPIPGIVFQTAAAAGNDQGAQLAAMCASCHRLDGGGDGIPNIAGIREEKLASALFAFRASESPSPIMHIIAISLSDQEIASVAHYLAERGK